MNRRARKLIAIWAGFVCAAGVLWGDGGTLQFRKQAGPFTVTVFSAPSPLRAGMADLSVLLQTSQDNAVVLDAQVNLELSKPGEPSVQARATTAQATNKILYAAVVRLPAAGRWHVTVGIAQAGTNVSVAGEINVLPEEPPIVTYWPYFAIVPLGLLLFVANQWLKSLRKSREPESYRRPAR